MRPLIDREYELRRLSERFARPSSFSLVYGQRRVGKTFLLQHHLNAYPGGMYFLADETTSRSLLARFCDEASRAHYLPSDVHPSDWSTALTLACQAAAIAMRPLRLVLDECQYLIEAEPSFPSLLQRIWDEHQDRLPLHIVLCGSALGTLGRLGEAGQPLHGRFGLKMLLRAFSYKESGLFTPEWTRRDRFRLFGLFGGLARHLAEVKQGRSLCENFCASVLDPLAPLHEAVPDMLRTEHLSSRAESDAILTAIAEGETGFNAIHSRAGLSSSRADYVFKELLALGLVTRDLRSGDRDGSRYARYRCADPFINAWYRFVRPNRGALQGTTPREIWDQRVAPRLDDLMGRVFEDIVRQAFQVGVLSKEVGPVDRIAPYWSRDGKTEIDLVVQAGKDTICCECKWHSQSLTDLDALRQLRDHVARHPSLAQAVNIRLCVASSTEFTPRLRAAAAEEQVLLVGPEQLLP